MRYPSPATANSGIGIEPSQTRLSQSCRVGGQSLPIASTASWIHARGYVQAASPRQLNLTFSHLLLSRHSTAFLRRRVAPPVPLGAS